MGPEFRLNPQDSAMIWLLTDWLWVKQDSDRGTRHAFREQSQLN
jgi:hypothetical protein